MSGVAGDGPPARSLESIRVERHEELDGWRERDLLDPGHAVPGGQEDTLVDERAGAARQESLRSSDVVRLSPDHERADIREQVEEVDNSERMQLRCLVLVRAGSLHPQRAASLVQAVTPGSAPAHASSFGSTSGSSIAILRSGKCPLGRTRHKQPVPASRLPLATELELPSRDEAAGVRSGGAPCVADSAAEGPSKSSRQSQRRFIVRSIPAEG